MAGFRRVLNTAVEQSAIATQGVSFDKERIHIETGVATLPPSKKYVSFATSYGTPPGMAITLAGTTVRNQAGTLRLSFDIVRIRPGSFQWVGTPNVRARWSAWGDNA